VGVGVGVGAGLFTTFTQIFFFPTFVQI